MIQGTLNAPAATVEYVCIDHRGIDILYDPDHSNDEDRFILLGTSYKLNTLVVCHCFREEETVIRIISARKADKDETTAYWKFRK